MDSFFINILDDSRDSDFSTPLCKIMMSEFLNVVRMYDVTNAPNGDSMESMRLLRSSNLLLSLHNH